MEEVSGGSTDLGSTAAVRRDSEEFLISQNATRQKTHYTVLNILNHIY